MQERTMYTDGRNSYSDPFANFGAMFSNPPFGTYDRLWWSGQYIYPDMVEGMTSSHSIFMWVVIILIIILIIAFLFKH